MKSILLLISLSILFNIQTNAQRKRQGDGRGQESGRIERIDRKQDNNSRDKIDQRTIKHTQTTTQEQISIQQTEIFT